MQALIEAAPVPASVADRLVRKIVHVWVFHSDEKLPGIDLLRASVSGGDGSSGDGGDGNNAASASRRGSGSTSASRRSSGSTTDSSLPMLRRQDSSSSVSR